MMQINPSFGNNKKIQLLGWSKNQKKRSRFDLVISGEEKKRTTTEIKGKRVNVSLPFHSMHTVICFVCSENLSNNTKGFFFSYLKTVCILLKSYASTILRYFPPCYRSPTGFIYSDNGVEFLYMGITCIV